MEEMEEMVMQKSYTTGKIYDPNKTVRLVNYKQVAFYMSKEVEILDFYPSNDFKTGEPILVFIVDKTDSHAAYEEWLINREKK